MLMASEETEQTIFVNWFRDNYPECIIFAIPNGGSRNLKEAVNLKKSGVLKGTPDLCILLLNKIIFIEMKKRKGGVVSKEQKDFIAKAQILSHKVFVAKGYEEAKEIVKLSVI